MSENPASHPIITVYWGDKSLVNTYDPARLRAVDVERAGVVRSEKAEMEWRVSRVLLQLASAGNRPKKTSLSHKAGHAALVCAPGDWDVGIDLEQVKPRDVGRLSLWMASAQEKAQLDLFPPEAALRHFYRLWTFKESVIKARRQGFPADLVRNTLNFDASAQVWRADIDGQPRWSVRTFETSSGWVLTIVWRAPAQARGEIQWCTSEAIEPPDFQLSIACETG